MSVSTTADKPIGSKDAFLQRFLENLCHLRVCTLTTATMNDYYLALAWTVRQHLAPRWLDTQATHQNTAKRYLCYLATEYVPGSYLRNIINSLQLETKIQTALAGLDLELEELLACEPEAGLGSGELGRLTACTLDALATLEIPTIAYGIRYELGPFKQELINGRQVERAEKWLRLGNPWEVLRPQYNYKVGFGGRTEYYLDADGAQRVRWFPERFVKGIAYDTPVPGHGVNTVNTLRLWTAEADKEFENKMFNFGDYQRAIEQKAMTEIVSKILYLKDEPVQNRSSRLEQYYFLVSCSIQDIIRIHLQVNNNLRDLNQTFAIQINDAFSALAIVELMRLLLDKHKLGWDEAWDLTYSATSYTGYNLLPMVLESWPIDVFGSLLPRHLDIIYEINHRFLSKLRHDPTITNEQIATLSLIDEQGGRRVRLVNLACVASHRISGIVGFSKKEPRNSVINNFYKLNSRTFVPINNSVSPRRFLFLANPRLTQLITDTIGGSWLHNMEYLQDLVPWAENSDFRMAWRAIKVHNKHFLASEILANTGHKMNPESMFDVQIKRIDEYKRQHLSILHVISRYLALKDNPELDFPARTWIYAGKAAPGAFLAQLMIELILGVARVVNNDPVSNTKMHIVFLPNFGVRCADRIYPAADLSEQLTTAGKESSGAGGIKFAVNGAITIGTADGTNLELQSVIGASHLFTFGLTESLARNQRAEGYRPRDYYEQNIELRTAIDAISQGNFFNGDSGRFLPLVDVLLNWDGPFVIADFASYMTKQRQIDTLWTDQDTWTRSSILNTASCSRFSTDKLVRDYGMQSWQVPPVPVHRGNDT